MWLYFEDDKSMDGEASDAGVPAEEQDEEAFTATDLVEHLTFVDRSMITMESGESWGPDGCRRETCDSSRRGDCYSLGMSLYQVVE